MTPDGVRVIDIDERFLRDTPLPAPQEDSDKEARGRVFVAGGSPMAPGSPMLSGVAALRAGAGKVLLGVPRSLAPAVGAAFPETGIAAFSETPEGEPSAAAANELKTAVRDSQAILIGPGLASEGAARRLTIELLESIRGPFFILDALALTGMKDSAELISRHEGRIVLTPHSGEMARLTGHTKEQVNADPLPLACETADRLNAVVVLKGATTFIANPGAEVFRHRGGVAGLGTAGSGDVLAGVIAGLLARGLPIAHACAWGVFVHAQAGLQLSKTLGTLGLIAREILAEIPVVLKRFE